MYLATINQTTTPKMYKTFPLAIFALLLSLNLIARESPKQKQKLRSLITTTVLRMDCAQATQQIDLSVNNVKATLLNGGDMWWDAEDGQYVVPKVDPSSDIPEVTSIFAGGLWMGGFDPAGNLKLAAQTYGSNSGRSDYWPGPLTETGQTENSTCLNWDRFYKVTALEIQEHLLGYQSGNYSIDDIPDNVKGWPARGNPYFFSVYGFDLPGTSQGLAAFWDEDGDGIYDPLEGDYPILSLRDCSLPIVPDEMIFWIINDAGNIHTQSSGDAIQMEVQNTAFAYATNDANNNHTFYHHKLINRAVESIDSFQFAYWIDIDLGCGDDDYMGSDPERNLAYGYNQDELDGEIGNTCGGVESYGDDIPMVGIDIFRGLRDIQNPNQVPLSSFMYYNRANIGPTGTADPSIAIEFYRYMTGSWRDGTPLTSGGSGYDLTSTQFTSFAFPDAPNDISGWSMCSENLASNDRRNVISSSGGVLFPGAINEISTAIVWSPSLEYPCPDISKFLAADDEAQALFDNCFNILNGPDAPDLEWDELDRQLQVRLVNQEKSNNFQEAYTEVDFRAPGSFPETERTYRFEGYRLYQLANSSVNSAELNDVSKARLVATVDVDNGIGEIINWSPPSSSNQGDPWTGTTMNPGATDEGITRSFTLSEDLFATGNTTLQNNSIYYYMVVAYAYNNYEDFSQTNGIIQGQPEPYLQGRRNVRVYRVSPKKQIPSGSTDDIEIVRLDGIGVNNNFLELADGEMDKMIDGSFDGSITYNGGLAPIDIFVKDPSLAMNNEYLVRFYLENPMDEFYRYKLFKPGETDTLFSESNTENYFEQSTPFGFNVGIGPSQRPNGRSDELRCGAIGASITTDGTTWLDGIADEESGVFDFVAKPNTLTFTPNINCLDIFDQIGNTFFTPFTICEADVFANSPIITPMFSNTSVSPLVQLRSPLDSLNNVNIVLTPDKSKWSRCVVVESATPLYYDVQSGDGIPTINDAEHFNLRQSRSVTKDAMPGEDFMAMPESDPNDLGMGWFPGYAVDVETGQRLNIFFGENSTYNSSNNNSNILDRPNGENMIWDPTSQRSAVGSTNSIYDYIAGGQHFMYVTREAYDECENIRERLASGNSISVSRALSLVTWTGLPLLAVNQQLNSYADGLIPAETVIKLRVQSPYENRFGTGQNNTLPEYLIRLGEDVMSSTNNLSQQGSVKIFPNPYIVQQSANLLTIHGIEKGNEISIHNLSGQLISYVPTKQLNYSLDGAQWQISAETLGQLTNGVYFLQIKSTEGIIRSVKWVVIQ